MPCEYPGDPNCITEYGDFTVEFVPKGPTDYSPLGLGQWALDLWNNFGIDINAEYGVSLGWWGEGQPPTRTTDPHPTRAPAPINPVDPVDVPAQGTPRVPQEQPEKPETRPSLPGSPREETATGSWRHGLFGHDRATWFL